MSDALVREALDSFTPAPDDAFPDWAEVTRRAELLGMPQLPGTTRDAQRNGDAAQLNGSSVVRPRRRRRWLAVAAAAVLLACSLALLTPVGPAVARTIGDFTDWLSGEPGEPAPQAEQDAFARATRSWAGFPAGTQLRRLVEAKTAGSALTLYGFRGAGSLCLRLEVAGRTEQLTCPPLSELKSRAQPALVVAADLGVGSGTQQALGPSPFPEPAARVTYGIVADGVERVEVRRNDGTTSRATVSGDTFVDVDDKPSFARRVSQVWAITGDRRVAIPFAPDPSIFGSTTMTHAAQARGPATVQRRLHGGAIRWLAHRQPRGTAVPSNVHHIVGVSPGVVFARQITPDPTAPERMVVSVGDNVCAELVGGRYQGGSCTPRRRMFSTAPFEYGVNQSGQYVTLAGLASDDVARLVLYLSTGKRLPVPLHDNGWMIEAARAAYPLRLVAYDRDGLVIGVVTFKGDSHPAPTPQRRPAPGAEWRSVLRNSTGEVFVIRALPDGTCTAFRFESGAGSLSCGAPPPAKQIHLGFSRSGTDPNLTFSGRVEPSITRLVVHLADGHTARIIPRDGYVLTRVPISPAQADRSLGSLIDSIEGFDAAGHRIARQSYKLLMPIGGGATVRRITKASITLGPSAATATKLRAQGQQPRFTTCRRTATSPPLDGYRPGIHIRYLCRGGALALIGRAPMSSRWPDRTIWGRGPITALTPSSITIRNELSRDSGGRPAPLTCSFTPTSPATNTYRRGQQVEVFCARGNLTGLNRDRQLG